MFIHELMQSTRTGRGFIDKSQLGELMDTLGIDATPEEVDLMLSEIDLGKQLYKNSYAESLC
jgi:Ca2+-binding EF-hand superfamily protein